VIDTISPTGGPLAGGTHLTITGTTLLGDDMVVKFGSTAAAVVSESAQKIVCTTPVHVTAGSVDVTVTVGGQASEPAPFIYYAGVSAAVVLVSLRVLTSSAAGTIVSVTPEHGLMHGGATVTLSGINLCLSADDLEEVTLCGVGADVVDAGPGEIVVHSGRTSVAHTAPCAVMVVSTAHGTAAKDAAWSYIACAWVVVVVAVGVGV
jgi:hypothetical protein